MSCNDYQGIIRQWFEDVMETHISKCASCSQFFLQLNKSSVQQLEQLLAAAHSARAHLDDEHRIDSRMVPSGTVPVDPMYAPQGPLHPQAQLELAQTPMQLPPAPAPLPAKAVMGRLSSGPEVDPTAPGLICNIGRFILDERELEMLRSMASQGQEPSELGLRILTIKALEDLKSILNDITSYENVVGWAIIGSDGLLLGGALPDDLNVENLAVRALSMYMGTEEMLERIGNERIQQLILRTTTSTIFLASFGEGIFVTISRSTDPDSIVRTLKRIRDVS